MDGWNVRKEKYGFKGGDFYDELSRRVECELDDYAKRNFYAVRPL
jgi:hypothetical protein